MNKEMQIEAIEVSIEKARNTVANKEALTILTDNPEFEHIILEGYFVKEASRLVLLKAEPAMQTADMQLAITKSIDAIGHLRQYFYSIIQLGSMAERALKDDEDTREELYREDIE